LFNLRPITDTGNEAVIAKILVEDSRGVFGGQVVQDDIYEGACVYGFGVVRGRFVDNLCKIDCIKLKLNDCRGVNLLRTDGPLAEPRSACGTPSQQPMASHGAK
jgi:hypothetical protein